MLAKLDFLALEKKANNMHFDQTFVRKMYPALDALVEIFLVFEKVDKVVWVNIPYRIENIFFDVKQ